MMRPCIICHRHITGGNAGEDDGDKVQEKLKRFFELLGRFLHPGGFSDDKEISRVPLENLIDFGIGTCVNCSSIVDSFCELYHQMKAIELLLHWKIKCLTHIMSSAQKKEPRVKSFSDYLKQSDLDIGNGLGEGDGQIIELIFNFKRSLIQKCTAKLQNALPRLYLHKCYKKERVIKDKVSFLEEAGSGSKDGHLVTPTLDLDNKVKSEPELASLKEELEECDDVKETQFATDIETDIRENAKQLGRYDTNNLKPEMSSAAGINKSDIKREASSPEPESDGDDDADFMGDANSASESMSDSYQDSEDYDLPSSDSEPDEDDKAGDFSTARFCSKQSAHKGKQFSCEICNKSFSRREHLKRHQKLNVCGKEWKEQLDTTGASAEKFSPAVNTPTTNKPTGRGEHQCPVCLKYYSTAKLCKFHHKTVHLKSDKFICVPCGKEFTQRKLFTRHNNIVHKLIRHECTKCKKSFTRRSHLAVHVQTVDCTTGGGGRSKRRNYHCKLCGLGFSRYDHLQRHMRNTHSVADVANHKSGDKSQPNRDPEKPSNSEPPPAIVTKPPEQPNPQVSVSPQSQRPQFACEVCEGQFTRKGHLARHRRQVHFKEPEPKAAKIPQRHICDQCGKVFNRPFRLKHHIDLIHLQLGEKDICDHCGKAFANSSSLNAHVKEIHLQIQAHECEVCKRKFNRKRDMDRHRLYVHREKKSN